MSQTPTAPTPSFTTSLIVLIMNADQTVGYINEAGCKMVGYSYDELIGRNWLEEFVVSDNIQEIKAYYQAIMCGEREVIEYYENHIRVKNNEARLVSWKSKVLRTADGKANGLITFGEDVTDRKVLLNRLLSEDLFNKQDLDLAIEHARVNEREEIAYELHDHVSQLLTTCKLLLGQEMGLGNQSAFVSRTFSLLKDVINDVRNISHRLSPINEGYTDIELSLKSYAEKIELATGIRFHLHITGEEALNKVSLQVSSNILRIVQEVTHNTLKHAHATAISINFQAAKNFLEMEIKDDGIGFDAEQVVPGLGLRSIRNRVYILKGDLQIITAPGSGCTIRIRIPW